MKKYKLRKDISVNSHKSLPLYRIQAVRSFGNVSKNDFGGYIQSEDNLSHLGDCWIYNDARVYDISRVFDDAVVRGDAMVYDCAHISDKASVSGYAKIYGDAKVYSKAVIFGNAEVFGNAHACGNVNISGNAMFAGFATSGMNTCIYGYANITRHEDKTSNKWIYGPDPKKDYFRCPQLKRKFIK